MKRAVHMICVSSMMLLAGCDGWGPSIRSQPINAETIEGKVRGRRGGGEEVRVWRDPDTGCQYLIWERRQRGGMTPRLQRDGRPMCGS